MAFGNVKKLGSRDPQASQASSQVAQFSVESSADIAAKIKTLQAECTAFLAQVETLLGKPFDAKSFEADVLAAQFRAASVDDATGLRDRIFAAQFNASKISAQLQYLEARRQDARAAEFRAGVARHAAILDTLGHELIAILKPAARVNYQIEKAHEAARREMGDEVRNFINPIVFNGYVRVDLVDLFAVETERNLANTKKKLAAANAPLLPSVAKAAAPAGKSPSGSGSQNHVSPATVRPKPYAGLQHSVQIDQMRTPGERIHADVLPDDTAPLGSGEVRVRVIRSGYCGLDGGQSHPGRTVRVLESHAKTAAGNGAVEILNETSTPANMNVGANAEEGVSQL